jgi:hypothetical protein
MESSPYETTSTPVLVFLPSHIAAKTKRPQFRHVSAVQLRANAMPSDD